MHGRAVRLQRAMQRRLHPTDRQQEKTRGRFLASRAGRFNIARMNSINLRDSIEQSLTLSQELDLDICASLTEAAGLLSEAEAVFRELAEPRKTERWN